MGKEIKKTTVRLEIDKTIQPKQYEPIKIQVSVEESFCWEEEKEREIKMESCRNKMIEDFVKCFDEACLKIGEENRCIGIISNVNSDIPGSAKGASNSYDMNDDEFEF